MTRCLSVKLRVNFEEEKNFGVNFAQSQDTFGTFQTLETVTENDYNKLLNLPSINSVLLQGNISLAKLGLRGIYYDTTAAWDMMPDMIGEEGYLYIYSDYQTITDDVGNVKFIPGIRIGDGKAYLKDLPFISDTVTAALYEHINNSEIHVTAAEKEFWNNKVSSYLDAKDNENLILSKTNFITEGDIFNG